MTEGIKKFEKIEAAVAAIELGRQLVGIKLLKVQRLEFEWLFEFDSHVVLQIFAPWRILLNGSIAFADGDDGHQFGLPAPVDGEVEILKIFRKKVIEQIAIREGVGDLLISFAERSALEVLNMSSGYEGWHLTTPEVEYICLGAGGIVCLEKKQG